MKNSGEKLSDALGKKRAAITLFLFSVKLKMTTMRMRGTVSSQVKI